MPTDTPTSTRCAPAAEQIAQRAALALALQIPQRQLQAGLRHRMAAHALGAALEISRAGHILAQDRRRQEIAQDVPGRARRLVGVAGIAVGHALAVADQALGVYGEQDALALGDAAERGLERAAQRHPQVVQSDAVDDHGIFRK